MFLKYQSVQCAPLALGAKPIAGKIHNFKCKEQK